MRHVRVGKDNTTITLEEELWEQLRIIAVTRNVAISQLLAEIDRTKRLQPAPSRISPSTHAQRAVRVFVCRCSFHDLLAGNGTLACDRLDRRGRYPEGCIQARRSGSRPHPERSRTIVIAAALRGILLAQSPFPLLPRRMLLASRIDVSDARPRRPEKAGGQPSDNSIYT